MIDNQKFWTEKYLVLVPIVIETLIVSRNLNIQNCNESLIVKIEKNIRAKTV